MLTPSPSSSPVNDTSSRKRQRSPSMTSDADSSSPKRAASQDLVQDSPKQKQTYNLDADIDAYMDGQGEASIPQTLEAAKPSTNNEWTPVKKLEVIDSLAKKPMRPDEVWYLVARHWYKRWRKALSGEEDKDGRITEADLGPVDNSPLVDSAGNLVTSVTEHVDVEYVPTEAWIYFVRWYGQPRQPLPRKVITRGMLNEPSLELFPPRIKVHLLTPQLIEDDPKEAIAISVSSKDTLHDVYHTILRAIPYHDIPARVSRRIWKLAEGRDWHKLHFPATRLKHEGGSPLEDDINKTVEEAMIESGDSFVIEEQELDGRWLIDGIPKSAAVSGTATPLSTTELVPGLFGTDTDFFGKIQAKAKEDKAPSLKPPVTIKLGPSPSGRVKVSKVAPGTLGLGNLGNTCFMNSAIQCLVHTKELSEYFLTGVFEEELNPDNPLGMHGAIAEAFGALLRRIWDPASSTTAYSPREFKSVLQRFAPQFAGYQQHDSQEFVAFLLDGLHEDLNRILKKPYVEKPDWEGGGDKELAALAKDSWDGYMKRNDSVIVDLFQGQYQSTLVCPECQKVSITFDPFMYLTLPLPVQKKVVHDVYYVPWDLKKPHVKVPVEFNRDASFREVRQLLGRWTGSDPDHLITLEIFSHRFYKDLDDHVIWGDVQDNDIVVCFELPVHTRQSRNYKRQEGDPFILPVFMCDTVPPVARTSYTMSTSISFFGYPFLVALDEKQASNPDAIYDAIIERLERWSNSVRDLYQWEAGSSDAPMEEVPIPIVGAAAPMMETVTEIKENGEIITIEQPLPSEGDIVDEKSAVMEEGTPMDEISDVPRKVGTKKGIFNLRLQGPSTHYGRAGGHSATYSTLSTAHFVSWEARRKGADADEKPVLLRQGDSLFAEFDENMKSYYFGDDRSAKWSQWEMFIHPEFAASKQAAAVNKKQKITLRDCLSEFTKEETLGEDDLWYCPKCKKHQQATKRFNLWKAPDVLVVHLKRFSNSRLLRDKIDAFVDFPIEGLDLTDMIGEREVGKRLLEENINIEEFGLHDIEEPIIYDLYAVDVHSGGLGAGHYVAYAHNHVTGKWYNFDDSYVSEVSPEASVTSNAYLLFYKRRTSRPLGGKSHFKIEEARNKPKSSTPEVKIEESQLPTPAAESSASLSYIGTERDFGGPSSSYVVTPYSDLSSPDSSPPPLDESEPPTFEAAQFDTVLQANLDEDLDPILLSSNKFDFPDLSSRIPASPSSSTGVEADMEVGTASPDSADSRLDSLLRRGSNYRNAQQRLRATRYLDEYDDSPDASFTDLSTRGATLASTDSPGDGVTELDIPDFDEADLQKIQKLAEECFDTLKGDGDDVDVDVGAHREALERRLALLGLQPHEIDAAIDNVDYSQMYGSAENDGV